MFDEQTLRALIDFEDPVGVLSFYVGFSPEEASDPQPRAPIEMRNQIKELRAQLDGQPRERARAVGERLDELGETLGGLLDPKASGRGRAMFVAVSDGRSERVSLQVPFRERVVLQQRAFVRPLVAAHDEGRPAGIMIAHRDGVRILQWAVGEAEELDAREFEVTDAMVADIKAGPVAANPQRSQQSAVHRERFEDRLDENRHRFLKGAVSDLVTMAGERGWDRVVVAGAPKIRERVYAAMPTDGSLRPLLAEQSWENENPASIADRAWPILRSVHRQREIDLVETVRERALSGGAGALGLADTLEAANQGKINHLLFDSDLQVEGFVSSEETLHADDEAAAGLELTAEPLLIERLVEKVVGMSGRVTPVDEEAAELLEAHGGVGALLRW